MQNKREMDVLLHAKLSVKRLAILDPRGYSICLPVVVNTMQALLALFETGEKKRGWREREKSKMHTLS